MNPPLPGRWRWSPRVRLRAWVVSRLPRSDRHETTHRNVYIVPSPAGWFFALVLLVLLVASINYQLSLGYALTFLLAGSAVVSMHMTHATLRSLLLHLRAPAPAFAGDEVSLEVVIDNPGRARHGIGLAPQDDGGRAGPPIWLDVPAQGRAAARLKFPALHRGWQGVPALTAHTRFPFGLFHAWTVWRPASRVLVWPRPERPAPPLPASQAQPSSAGAAMASPGSGFEGVRPWRCGDSLRQVAWKKVARTPDAELVSRDSHTPSSRELWLDWQAARTPEADPEARLSRLAAWVMAAEASASVFGLRLPGVELPLASGERQRRDALDALALWQ